MATETSSLLVVFVTVPSQEIANELARKVVEARLVACVNMLSNVQSIYRWEGKIEESKEILLIMKTVAARFPQLEQHIVEIHPYECPEILAVDASKVTDEYCAWVTAETESN